MKPTMPKLENESFNKTPANEIKKNPKIPHSWHIISMQRKRQITRKQRGEERNSKRGHMPPSLL